MLYPASITGLNAEDGTIQTRLCRRCFDALRQTHANSAKPAARMPSEARANGLWRGPDPTQLACLSYNEAKVINLARIYVSVKRVFLDRASYARTSASEAPLYHQKNVVAKNRRRHSERWACRRQIWHIWWWSSTLEKNASASATIKT